MQNINWIDIEANYWGDDQMAEYIWFQNNYSYDGEPPMTHSAKQLIDFCDMENPIKISKFNEIYNMLYPSRV